MLFIYYIYYDELKCLNMDNKYIKFSIKHFQKYLLFGLVMTLNFGFKIRQYGDYAINYRRKIMGQ